MEDNRIAYHALLIRLVQISVVLLGCFTPFGLSAQCPQLVWWDDFDGAELDDSKWTHQTGDGCDQGVNLCGWGNNELQWYQPQNAVVSDGTLKIIAKREQVQGKNYSSSRIRTAETASWTYGRFEASIKLPKGQGLWPAFWMLPTEEKYGGWPQSGEIDIVELIGSEPEVAHGTIHFGNLWPGNRSSGASFRLQEGIFNDSFHEFAVEWEENEIRWYVDDYLYSTKNRSNTSPFRWPFDQDFHLLLNVAVGGNWPGNPNASTPFPQTMEVDYVRVYNGAFPYLTGNRTVTNRAQGEKYIIRNTTGDANFSWTVPEGATIVSGQGSNTIIVNWGDAGGELKVMVEDQCITEDYGLQVEVEEAFAREFSFENFDDPARVSLSFATGTFEDEVVNPEPDDLNGSNLTGKYQRDGSQQFDVLSYDIDDLGNAALYKEGNKKFYLDVYTAAPAGTLILLQLEDKSLSQPDNYPRGRHSRFEARTTVQNSWQRLEFKFLDAPDPTVGNLAVDQFIFLFASNSLTSDIYYIDNFDAYAPASTVGVSRVETAGERGFIISPNPVTEASTIRNISDELFTQLELIDTSGRILRQETLLLSPGESKNLNIENVPPGVYLFKVITRSGKQYLLRTLR